MTRSALIVVNYGSSALLAANLAPAAYGDDVQILVVDNFSTAAEQARVRDLAAEHGWTAVLLDDNRGFGAGVNAGAEAALEARVDVLLTLNPDARLDPAALRALASAAVASPRALVSPTIVTSEGAVWFDGADLYLDDGVSAARRKRELFAGRERREWATGACFAMSAAMWSEIGGFDDDYFLYWEDIDLSHRVLDAGGTLEQLAVQAVHDEGGTHGEAHAERAKSETYYFYNIRNRLLYAAKHLDSAHRRRWRRRTLPVSYGILLQGGRRQLVTSTAPWRALVRGIRDGRRLLREAERATG